MYTKIHLQLNKSPNEVKNKNECFIITSIPGNVHNLCARAKLYGETWVYFGTSLSSLELSDWELKCFALSYFDRKTFLSYSSSALYVAVPGYYLNIIWIDFLKIIQRTKSSFISKISGWNFSLILIPSKQTAQPELYTVSVSVKQL